LGCEIAVFLFVSLFLCTPFPLVAQTGQWAWIGGSNTAVHGGVYGTLGVANASNMPGTRDSASTWADSSGNLWLFGGEGYDVTGHFGLLNDLWEYSPSTGMWTWMGGSNTLFGNAGLYGTQGIASLSNAPGARWEASSWVDANGNLWLFSGQGYDVTGHFGFLNDLWEYTPSTGMWTWMGGSELAGQSGVYGTLGVTAAGNLPGARSGASTWMDSNGNLWLFGGLASVQGQSGGAGYNDLWEYTPSTGQWTWMGGSSLLSQSGTPGALGIPAAGNVPGARWGSAAWTDSSGNFWLFGGQDCAYACSTQVNDLWQYSPSAGQWTWMGGRTVFGEPGAYATNLSSASPRGVYGTLGFPSSGNLPGARYGASAWADSKGYLWLFGGFGDDGNSAAFSLSDLWRYSTSTGQWTWMGGSNLEGQPGVYNTLGAFSPTATPGRRTAASSWTDPSGNLWLFGGVSYWTNADTLNDLWEFAPPAE
jgi:N-acetylneuraminic acid mutarotase